MSPIDYIALAVIFLLFFCAARYIYVSRKKGCGGNCMHCRQCTELCRKHEDKNK